MVYLPTFGQNLWPNVGEYTSPMDPMGYVIVSKTEVDRFPSCERCKVS